ncbi:DUF805 domain-containing protein [Brevundimonas sp.]|uniref:DUF805 domain-containing protein n=1 Tax=Brevundimonas sp. TaxID=1871086 RepID=UPI002D781606|nr:DUF805 domain-containing protein [Brevundimonas sp.]
MIHTVYCTFTFSGRSRAMEVVYYWLASMLAGFLISFLRAPLPWDVDWVARSASDIVLGLPFFALFARRMHDQGFSAWWTLLLLPLPLINLYQSYRAVFAVRNPSWLHEPGPLDGWVPWFLGLALVLMVLFLLPGTRGPNRYGPDSRNAAAT